MRTLDVYYDIFNQRLCDSAGAAASGIVAPYIHALEKVLVRLRLLDMTTGAAVAWTGLNGASFTYSAVINDTFAGAQEAFASVADAAINDGSWADSDPATGKFSLIISGNNVNYLSRIGSAERVTTNTQLEILALDTEASVVGVVRIPFTCLNVMYGSSGTPEAPVTDYYTKTQVDALLAGTLSVLSAVSTACVAGQEYVDVVWDDMGSAPSAVIPALYVAAGGAGASFWIDGAPTATGCRVRLGAPAVAGWTVKVLVVA